MIERTTGGSGPGVADRIDERAPRGNGRAPRTGWSAIPIGWSALPGAALLLTLGARIASAHPAESAMDLGAPSARSPTITAVETALPRSAPVTRVKAVEQAVDALVALVRTAHRGELPQRELRAARLRVERRLARSLAGMPADLRPNDGARFDRAVARLNQIIIRSQEWEAFGARPRPEWGWDPQREIVALATDDSVLESGEVVVIGVR